jgi:hypothetical protein
VGFDETLNSVIVTFRGSDNILNWMSDAFMLSGVYLSFKNCIGCLIHKGFRDAYGFLKGKGLDEKIKIELGKHPGSSIIFTGHSLGGALANYAAVRLSEDSEGEGRDILVYTFGQPRVGNFRYNAYFKKQVPTNYRVVHKDDLVPHLPTNRLRAGLFYQHGGTEVWYNLDMRSIFGECEGDSSQCSNRRGEEYTFDDHSSRNYVKLAKRIKEYEL